MLQILPAMTSMLLATITLDVTTPRSAPPPRSTATADVAMARQPGQAGRLIWDYRDTAPAKVSLPDYHQWLLDYCRSETPARLVLYVTSPLNAGTGFCDFYDPTAAPANGDQLNLVGFLQTLAQDPQTGGVVVHLLMDASSFRPDQSASCGGWTPQPVDPTTNGVAPPALPAGWPAFATALDWVGTLASNAALTGGGLDGIAIDPESKQNTGTIADDYAALAVWMDMFRTSGPTAVGPLDFGMTVGVSSHTLGKLLTTEFPVPAGYPVAPLGGMVDAGRMPTYRTTDRPLLDDIYFQVYAGCEVVSGVEQAGSFYRWICEGGCDGGTTQPRSAIAPWSTAAETSANLLAATLQRRPELPGPGTITATANPDVPNPDGGNPGGSDLVGLGTRFDLWPAAARVQLVDGTDRVPAAPWAMLNAAGGPEQTSVNGGQVTQASPLPYVYTEISIDYAAPSVTTNQIDRLWFLFSAEKADDLPFFGYWTYADFESFLQSFGTVTGTTDGAPFADGQGDPIAATLQCGIYSLRQASLHWGADFYAQAYPAADACLTDLDGDGVVGASDLGVQLMHWGTAHLDADLDRSGQVDAEDVASLLDEWGACP